MNNNLLLQAQKWLTELGIKTEAGQTILKINRKDVYELGMFNIGSEVDPATFLNELKSGVSKKLYFENGDELNFHLNAF